MSNELTPLDENEKEIVLQGFDTVFHYCKYKDIGEVDVMFNGMFGSIFGFKDSNFRGGCGQVRTIHENMMAILYPAAEQQVVFGTGKGGHKKWLSKKFTADFFDRKNNFVIEIDGFSHQSELAKIKDRLRTAFFQSIGIRTARFTNKEVEGMMLRHLKKMFLNIGEKEFIAITKQYKKAAKL